MEDKEKFIIRLPFPHHGQAIILNNTTRFRVVACGRRFGKTELAKRDLMLTALDGGVGWWVMPTYQMAQDVWNEMVSWLESLEFVKIYRSDKLISFANRGQIAIKSGHEPDRLRGAGLSSVVIDEAAYCHEDVWRALRPALGDHINIDIDGKPRLSGALLLSTPRGRNWFWSLYQKGFDPDEPDWVSWRMPSSANPYIPLGDIEIAKRELPERQFRQEYLAEFLDDSSSVFRNIKGCVKDNIAWRGESICFGVDWGRMNDFTVIIVLGMETHQVYEILRFNQINWAAQRSKLINLAERWQPTLILAEANSIGSPNIELLQSEGLPIRPFTTTHASKNQIIDGLALALETGSISLPNEHVLLHELAAYEMERLPSGEFRYGAPPNGHDDTVMALALALHAARFPRARVQPYV